MALVKPSWLSWWLDRLNWEIFTWKIYVGDAIEAAIDWVIAWINYAIDIGQAVWNWLASVVDWVVDLWNTLIAYVNQQVQAVWNYVTTWADDLNTWWAATWDYVINWVGARFDSLTQWVGATRDWIMDSVGAITDQLQDRVSIVTGAFNNLSASWNNFLLYTLPGLASRLDVKAAIEDFMLTWRDLFDWWGEFRRDVADFFADPFAWIYDRLDEFFERYW